MVEDVREKKAVIENVDWKYEEKCENTGRTVSPFDGIREFRERVWPSVGRAIISEYTLGDTADDYDDYYNNDYSDNNYPPPREYDDDEHDNGDDSDWESDNQ
jgi:hypothetical protein